MTNWTFDQHSLCKHNSIPDRWNCHNPEYSPIIIIIQKFNRTNPGKGIDGGGLGYLRGWERWFNISFIRNRCWMAGFYRSRLPRKMAAIFTFYNSLWFIRHCKIGTTIHRYIRIYFTYFALILYFPFFFIRFHFRILSCFPSCSFFLSVVRVTEQRTSTINRLESMCAIIIK